ncbi:hypothetical protein [Shimia ponticola]|uniref:hypothetical protein n=1 Tax=Shimia ponticola TaxID=2582893 RepID=UPI0011BDB36A|nr:hypothetical protein [Shimia ponticola]
MVGNNKVLTVSYGTFSCTLEGFEDSFDTMKAIAEYFRDLAAEDRYFGAEPPQPDAEVMARIAEREVARNVQARTEGGRVLLQTAPATAAPAPETETAPSPSKDTAAADAAPSVHEQPNEDMTTQPVSELSAPEQEADQDTVPEAADQVEAPEQDAAVQARAATEVNDAGDAQSEDVADEDDADSEAAAVEAKREAKREARARRQARRAARAAEAEAAAEAAEAEEQQAEIPPAELEADDAAQETSDEDDLQVALSNAEQAEPVQEPEPDEGDSLTAKLRRIQAVVGTAAVAGGAVAATSAAKSDDEYSEDEHAEDFSETASEDTADAEEPQADGPAPVRVLKMKKKDFEAVIEDGAVEEITDEQDAESIFSDLDGLDELAEKVDDAEVESTLSREEEDELARELAALEEEADDQPEPAIASEDDGAFDEDAPAPANRGQTVGRAVLEQQADTAETAVNRLLEKTEEAMDEPASKTRRNAISHLKAAVAATVAERKAGTPRPEAADKVDQPYREDLARVVRPKRPAKRAEPVEAEARQQGDRPKPAPLKLVASQRVDATQPKEPAAPAQPVRPRRVEAKAATEAASPEFAKFAASVGADEIPDMLEAAASFTTFVEGNEVFSRPQVMRLVQSALPDGSFSREDGLRAFGTLLRQGRMNKIRGGQFEVTEHTRFVEAAQDHGGARAAG